MNRGRSSREARVALGGDDLERLAKHVHSVEHDAQLPLHAQDEVHGYDRLAAELEEIVVQTRMLGPQQLSPQRREQHFRFCFGFAAGVVTEGTVGWCRQGVTVELHVVVDRHALEVDVDRRNHVVRHVFGHVSPDGRNDRGPPPALQRVRVDNDIAYKGIGVSCISLRSDDALAHARCTPQVILDLVQFDAHSPNFDLEVRSAQKLQPAVLAQASDIAGAIVPLAAPLDEPLSCQVGAAKVSTHHPGPGEVDVAGHPGGHRAPRRVQHSGHHVREWAADIRPCYRLAARHRISAAHAADLAAAVDDEYLGVLKDLEQLTQDLRGDSVPT